MERLYLGVDVGTTHLKVCAVDVRGNCLSVCGGAGSGADAGQGLWRFHPGRIVV